jgi:hypothetical protein
MITDYAPIKAAITAEIRAMMDMLKTMPTMLPLTDARVKILIVALQQKLVDMRDEGGC